MRSIPGMSRAVMLMLVTATLITACEQPAVSSGRRAPGTAPSEWAAQRGIQTGDPSASVDPRNDITRTPARPSDQRSFMVVAGIIIVIIGVVIAGTVWWLEARRRRMGDPD